MTISINDLPTELITKILDYIQITDWAHIGYLTPCYSCTKNKTKCRHLVADEKESIKELKLVCSLWNEILKCKNFEQFAYMPRYPDFYIV